MNASFNVLDQGWIPVVYPDGTRQLLGIRQTLACAHELVEISDPSPLEEYSLYRFLGLFLMDALRPKRKNSIRMLLQKGQFDMEEVETYIRQCEAEGVSFDLFDAERPFLQSKYDSAIDGAPKPVSVLDCTIPSGNNHTHFNHDKPASIQPGKAAVLLLTTYLFCTAAAQGYPSGPYGAPPYFGVIKGKNLFESLAVMMIPQDAAGVDYDVPPVLWRAKEPVRQKAEIAKTSLLRGLLFPSRRITLLPDTATNLVTAVYLSQGENFVNKDSWRDPYATYRSNDTSVFPLRPHADAPIWRNYCDIIDIPGEHASQMLRQYQSIHREEEVHLTLYGVETNQASFLSVQRCDFTLPLKLSSQICIDIMKACINSSQQLSKALRRSLKDISLLPVEMEASSIRKFDMLCEARFWELCRTLKEESPKIGDLYCAFCADVSKSALQVFDSALLSLQMRARTMTETESARTKLCFEVFKVNKKEET